MRSRFFWLVGMRLFAAGTLAALIFTCLMPGSGEREFQKTLDAMKNVHTFRALMTTNPGTQLNDFLWEVDCDQQIMHKVTHNVDTRIDPPIDQTQDEIRVGHHLYTKQIDGTWKQSMGAPPKYYCDKIAAGTDSGIMPRIATMLKKGIIQKGEKKTVNGVRCREWDVASRNGLPNIEHATVCIGLDDHLPYELTLDWARSRTTYSDYNTQISFDLPDAALQPASATN
jgi:hypothetical protein